MPPPFLGQELVEEAHFRPGQGLRPSGRGIEEGTFYVADAGMGYAGIDWAYQPTTLWNFCRLLEDEGKPKDAFEDLLRKRKPRRL